MGKFIGNSDEQFEELANRVDELISSRNLVTEILEEVNKTGALQLQQNQIFNDNFIAVYRWFYGLNVVSALAIEGEI